MWNSEEVVLVKADQLGLSPGQVAVFQRQCPEGEEPQSQSQSQAQAFMLPQGSVLPPHTHTPLICISVLGADQEEEEEEEEEEERHTTEAASPASPEEVVSMEIGGEDDPSAEGHAEGQASEGSGSVLEEAEAEEADDPDYDPECETPSGHRAFQCQQCQRRFNTRQGLERHTHIHTATSSAAANTHTNTQTLKCRFCTKTFGTQFGRRRHERRHESERKRLGRSCSASGHAHSPAPSLAQIRPTSTSTQPIKTQTAASERSPTVPTPATAPQKVDPAVKIPPPPSPLLERKQAPGGGECVGLEVSSSKQRGAHVCRHCHKAFGTHTNLRRHQRRVHERHLLPRRLATTTTAPPLAGQKSAALPSQQQTGEPVVSSGESPALIGQDGGGGVSGGGATEEEVEREEYMVDISSNISENLSFYIDGKIVSTSALSGCEVIEINSGSTALIGLDTLIISPAQIAQALKMQSGAASGMMISSGLSIPSSQSASRRRTATPPLLPQIKTELESEPILTTTSSSSSPASFLPSASVAGGTVVGTVVGTVLSQPADAGSAQREKTVYLSPKLKQLLQTQQDGSKPTFALIADGQRLAPPLSLTVLPSASRFKRRTGSPPSTASPPSTGSPPATSTTAASPTPTTTPTPAPVQQSPAGATESGEGATELPQDQRPTPEAQCSTSPSLSSKDDPEQLSQQAPQSGSAGPAPSSPLGLVMTTAPVTVPVAPHQNPPALDWAEPRTGGSPCNQQPLDLSSAGVSRREGSEELGEAALDLSMPSRSTEEGGEGASLLQLQQLRKAKPSSSMLQQVLMSDCASLAAPAAEQGTNMAALVTDVALVTAASAVPAAANPERLVVELALPPTSSQHPPTSTTTPSASLAPVVATQASPDNPTPSHPPLVLPSASSSVVMVTSAPAQLLPMSSATQPALTLLPAEASSSGGGVTDGDKDGQAVKAVLPHWGASMPICLGGVESLQSQTASGGVATVGEMSFAGPTTTDFVTPIPALQAFAASVNVNESAGAVQSYSIIPNAVVIECTVSLESSQTFVPTFSGGTIESPYGKIILGPSEHLQPYTTPTTPQPHQAPKPTLPPAGPAPNTTDPNTPAQANPSLPAAPPPEEPASSSIKDESQSSESRSSDSNSSQSQSSDAKSGDFQSSESKSSESRSSEAEAEAEAVQSDTAPPGAPEVSPPAEVKAVKEEEAVQQVSALGSSFVCNVCSKPFVSMKELSRHIGEHAEAWPYKCEFCVQLFESAKLFLDHRSTYHGIGKIYVCSACSKEFAFLCNLQQHQKDLHPGQTCSHTEVEDGRLRPQNYNSPNKDNKDVSMATETTSSSSSSSSDPGLQENERMTRKKAAEKEEEKEEGKEREKEEEFDTATEELYTTIKIMASGVGRSKGPDVRMGTNQHYPSFKPPPFPYHNRTPTGSVASATNFTTHNIPQTFSTAIRCTKCGQSFDNMPELHKHILACANASDKRRYTPKKNPIPLKQFARAQNGVLSPTTAANIRQNVSRKAGTQGSGGGGGGGKRPNVSQESLAKLKLSALNKRKAQLVQRAVSQRNKSAAAAATGLPKRGSGAGGDEEQGTHVCPHCRREFTYRASLSKHIALSCPSKPISKKARKRKEGAGMSLAQENNANVRRRSPDGTPKHQGALQPPRPKLVAVRTGEHMEMKRSAILISAPGQHPLKRSKNGPTNVLSPITDSNSPSNSQSQSQSNPQQQQLVPMRVRERQGGPVTRSLQQARSMAPPSGQAEAGTAAGAGAGAGEQPGEEPQPQSQLQPQPQVGMGGRK